MKELVVVWVGRKAAPHWEEVLREYRERLARLTRFSEVQVRPASGRDRDPGRALALEAESIGRALRERDGLVVLDETGQKLTSEELSIWLGGQHACPRLVFVVGSDLGLDRRIKERARLRLSLSPMTLPHLLARVVLLEQLYRSLDIQSGGPYHRTGVAGS